MRGGYADASSLEQIAGSVIEAGEHLLWVGKPGLSRVTQHSVGYVLMGIAWVLFWLPALRGLMGSMPGPHGLSQIEDPIVILAMLADLGVGIGFMIVSFWLVRKERRTVYTITDRRVAIICGAGNRSVASYRAADMCDFWRTDFANGAGNLAFATDQIRYRVGRRMYRTEVGFYGIPEVRAIERLMLETFKKDAG